MTQRPVTKTAARRAAEPDRGEPPAERDEKPGRRIVLPGTGSVAGDHLATRPLPMGHRVLDER